MSTTSLVLTILGQDRPGLVEAIAETVAAHQGNWVESRMAHLAGQFAGVLRVEVDAERSDALLAALGKLQETGLESVVAAESAPAAADPRPTVQLDLIGQDRPGIVREVSRVLAAHGVNVEELQTECATAPNSGQALFKAAAQLRLPSAEAAEALREALEKVAADMMVEVIIE
ncbi:MAG: ACT domain-containing protein [Planctomycetota bacterium]